MPEPADLDTTEHNERDAASIRILGGFFTILGLLVLVATLAALNSPHGAIVNAVSGLILMAIGIAMLVLARRIKNSKSN